MENFNLLLVMILIKDRNLVCLQIITCSEKQVHCPSTLCFSFLCVTVHVHVCQLSFAVKSLSE